MNDVADEIQKIKNGSFNLHEIPHIISIIANVYRNTIIKKKLDTSENIISFVKLTLDTLIDSNLIVLPDIEKQVLEFVVDKSLDLLALNIVFVEKETKYVCNGCIIV